MTCVGARRGEQGPLQQSQREIAGQLDLVCVVADRERLG
jgi:hypothetical protein